MKSLLLIIAVLTSAVSSAFSGQLILEGPGDRGETPLASGEGRFKVDVYGQNLFGFAALQTVLSFSEVEKSEVKDFQISLESGNPTFGGQAIWLNESRFPAVFPIYINNPQNPFQRRMSGFMLMEGEADISEKTLLYSLWYDYGFGDGGSYVIGFDPAQTLIVDGSGAPISCEVAAGRLAIISEPSGLVLFLGLVPAFLFLSRRRYREKAGN